MASLAIEPEQESEPEPAAAHALTGQGICAVVLYDYEVCILAVFDRNETLTKFPFYRLQKRTK